MSELLFAAVIPARGGSSRIPRKNIAALGGRPLIEHTIDACIQAGFAGATFVTTDDDEIAIVAERSEGVRVIRRPSEFATDESTTESALIHVLDTLADEGMKVDWVVTLPPTSPLRTGETIRAFCEAVRAEPDRQDCLMSVTENRGDFWHQGADGLLERINAGAPRRQQDRVPMWEENSAIYVTRATVLRATGSILGARVRGMAIDVRQALDINTPADLDVAQALLAHG